MPNRHLTPLVALLLAGCATYSPSGDAALALPVSWHSPGDATQADIARDWWRGFGSAELDALVERAEHESLDLAAAIARVRQVEASARIAGAALLPELNGSLGASREGPLDGNSTDATAFRAGLAASYEVDFWGRNRAGQDSARAELAASAYDRDTVRLTVTAGAATLWLQAVALQERADIAERNLQSAERLLALVESRARAGAATPLELAQQRGLVASQRRAFAALRQQAGNAQTALAALVGVPSGIEIEARSLGPLQEPVIGAGLPSALIARRPDIARAEARLDAATADVAAARAAMLPSVTLSGSVGSGGSRFGRVFDNPLYSLAAGLAAPIFNGGRLAAGRDLAQARREELLAGYRQTIVTAFGDVEAALTAVSGVDAQREAQAEELAQAERALALAESRYRAGADTLLTLLDTQRTLYAAQDATVSLKADRLQAAVALYRALGGGWREPPVIVTEADGRTETAPASRMNAAARPHAESPGS